MKKFTIIPALLLVLVSASPAMAQDDSINIKDTVKSEIESKKAEVQNKIKENQQKLKEDRAKKEDRKEEKAGFHGEIIKMRASVATKVFDATLERLAKLIERIESRSAKLRTEGMVTTDVDAAVAAAKANIADAKTHITIMNSIDLSTVSSTTAKTNFKRVKSEAKLVREALTKAKQNLQKAVKALAKFEKEHKKTASTTSDRIEE